MTVIVAFVRLVALVASVTAWQQQNNQKMEASTVVNFPDEITTCSVQRLGDWRGPSTLYTKHVQSATKLVRTVNDPIVHHDPHHYCNSTNLRAIRLCSRWNNTTVDVSSSSFTPYVATATLGWSILSTTETFIYAQTDPRFPKPTATTSESRPASNMPVRPSDGSECSTTATKRIYLA